MPHFLSALISLIVVISVLLTLVLLIVPVIINQAQYLSTVDLNGILDSLRGPMASLDLSLRKYGLIAETDSVENMLFTYIGSFLNSVNIKAFAGDLLGMAGKLSVGLFSVIFLSYFFMRDDQLLYKGLKTFTPRDSHDEIARILFYSKKMLSRYFLGLFAELVCVIALISIGMYIIGLENALFIGVLAGIFNIIPYIGPLIGGAIGCMIGLTTLSPEVFADQSGMLILQMLIVFVTTNLIDEFVLQPTIFSRSVKAHPIEIFIIILMAGTLFGPIGMVLAIPTYTLLRIIAIEFFSHWDFVQNLTQNLNKELKKTRENESDIDE
jgi:predicted PurR-regulated permease PerM